ncbi:ImmA/IrrE family metallo-endopeptidase [Streptomyces flaveolus]|uniref:ImmA/IrrE family metallo-endopeptidase n=1 Tax=Streptomyces flaveolus TaxID=67297 RepID=UPI0033C95B63
MARAEAKARNIVDEQNLTALPIDAEAVARSLGATVIAQPTPDELSGMLLRRDGQIVIGVNSGHAPARQRFALAHLIGHLLLHRSRDLLLDTAARYSHGNLPSMPTDREEAEANRFAAALLAPDSHVRRLTAEADFRTAEHLVDLLTPRFELTRTTMACRLMSLGIIADM